ALRKSLLGSGWDGATVWSRFDGTLPHVIPADVGVKEDLVLYENAFVFAAPPGDQGDPMAMAYLQAGDVVKIGDTWKFVSLPQAINPSEPATIVADAGIRAAVYRAEGGGGSVAAADDSPELAAAKEKLAAHDQKAPQPDAAKQE